MIPFSYQVHRDDRNPQQMCAKCWNRIMKWNEFRQRTIECNQIFIESVGVDQEEIDDEVEIIENDNLAELGTRSSTPLRNGIAISRGDVTITAMSGRQYVPTTTATEHVLNNEPSRNQSNPIPQQSTTTTSHNNNVELITCRICKKQYKTRGKFMNHYKKHQEEYEIFKQQNHPGPGQIPQIQVIQNTNFIRGSLNGRPS